MIFLINNLDQKFFDMEFSTRTDSDILAMSELTKEIGAILQKSVDEGNRDLTPSDIEHILKLTSDVTNKIKSEVKEITV